MSSQALSADSAPTHSLGSDLLSLTKPRLSGLVLFTAAGGTWLARTATWQTWLFTLLGTAGTVAAANAFNCIWERESDKLMARTANRPLPAGRLSVATAFKFATALTVISLPMLAIGVNLLTAALGLLALLSYVLVYTPMKSRTHWAMLVGAIPGALPPLMGWTAVTNRIDLTGMALFGILFFWQLPHFIAIALFRKEEYRAAGLHSVPLDFSDNTARLHAVGYLVALFFVSMVPALTRTVGLVYLLGAIGLGAHFMTVGLQGWWQKGDARWAKRFFLVSLLYLVGLFLVAGLDSLLSR